jgi:hypothetical protein
VGAKVAALAVLVGLVGIACGADRTGGPRGTPLSVVAAAPGRTRAAGSARVDIGVGERLAGTGVVRFEGDTVRARLRLAPVRAAAAGGAPVDLALDGARGWLRLSAPGPGPWVPGTLPAMADAAASRLGANPAVGQLLARPGAGLEVAALAGATDVETYGGAEVRGASTIRYHLTVDLQRAAAAVAAAGGPAAVAAELRAAANSGAARFPADVWIDGPGRVRRLQFPADPTATVTTVSADNVPFGVLTIDLFDFGVSAPVEDPTTSVGS